MQLPVMARLLLPSSSSLKRLSILDAGAVPNGALASLSIAIAIQAAANALAVAYAQLHRLPSSVRISQARQRQPKQKCCHSSRSQCQRSVLKYRRSTAIEHA